MAEDRILSRYKDYNPPFPSRKVQDLTGLMFGCLTVVKYAGNNSFLKATWLCRCECGQHTIATNNHLRAGNTKGCGDEVEHHRRLYPHSSYKRVLENTTTEPNSGCVLWLGPYNKGGYGSVSVGGKTLLVHRLACEIRNGSIPKGMMACHTCDVSCCVNPEHLYIGTAQSNMADKVMRGRSARGSKNGRAILSERQVQEIFSQSKANRKMLSVKYGVSESVIKNIRSGLQWRHVTHAR